MRTSGVTGRWLSHSVLRGSKLNELLADDTIRSSLEQQLEQAAPQLQDKEFVEVELPVPAGPPQRALRHLQIAEFTADPAADQQPMLPWLGNVRLVRVAANGPGHRAFNQT